MNFVLDVNKTVTFQFRPPKCCENNHALSSVDINISLRLLLISTKEIVAMYRSSCRRYFVMGPDIFVLVSKQLQGLSSIKIYDIIAKYYGAQLLPLTVGFFRYGSFQFYLYIGVLDFMNCVRLDWSHCRLRAKPKDTFF